MDLKNENNAIDLVDFYEKRQTNCILHDETDTKIDVF